MFFVPPDSPFLCADQAGWTPLNLVRPTHGVWLNFSNSPTVTLASGNVSAISDAYGSGKTLSAPAGSVVPIGHDAGGQAFAEIRQANASGGHFPGLTGSSIASTTAGAPFTLSVIVRFVQGPSSSTDDTSSVAVLGGTLGAGGLGPIIIGIAGANLYGSYPSVYGWPTNNGLQVWGTFGRQTLASGVAGNTIPSKQNVTLVYDGTTLSLWVDGMLLPASYQALGSGGTHTVANLAPNTSNLSIGRWFNPSAPADHDVYELLLLDYAMTAQQVKQYAAYAQRTYGIEQTAPNVLCDGDSYVQGLWSTQDATTSFVAQLPGLMSTMFGFPLNVVNMGIAGTTSGEWLDGSQTFNGFEWQAASFAMGIAPMSVQNLALADFGFNDATTGVPLATRDANMATIGGILRGWGVQEFLGLTIPPLDATALAAAPSMVTKRTPFNAGIVNAVGTTFNGVLNWDAIDTTAIPGVGPWNAGATYNPPPAAPPQLVTFGGTCYYALATSTGVTPGTDATKWRSLTGSGATFATLVATQGDPSGKATGDGNHLHEGTDAATGDFGPTVYAHALAMALGRMLRLM